MEAGSPLAGYARLHSSDGDRWRIEPRSLEYDLEAAAVLAEDRGRDDVAYALRTGRVGPSEPASRPAPERHCD